MLLERDRQLDDLTTFAAGSTVHGGGVVLVAGEAGIGKTSLVRAFARLHRAGCSPAPASRSPHRGRCSRCTTSPCRPVAGWPH